MPESATRMTVLAFDGFGIWLAMHCAEKSLDAYMPLDSL
jgi:hypothetical protein